MKFHVENGGELKEKAAAENLKKLEYFTDVVQSTVTVYAELPEAYKVLAPLHAMNIGIDDNRNVASMGHDGFTTFERNGKTIIKFEGHNALEKLAKTGADFPLKDDLFPEIAKEQAKGSWAAREGRGGR